MTFFDVIFYVSLAGGFLMAFSLGANDVANSMASAVGARAITVWQAVAIAGVMNFFGAVFLGAHVTATIAKGIVNPEMVTDVHVLAVGMFSVLLSAGLFVLMSTLTAFPVSSTHAVVGGLIGFAYLAAGPESVQWSKLTEIFISWVLSPVLAGIIAGAVYGLIKLTLAEKGDVTARVKKWCPIWMAFAAGVIALALTLDAEPAAKIRKDWFLICLVVIFFVLFMWEMGKNLIREYLEKSPDHKAAVEQIFRRLQIFTSSYVALAHGSNDVANAFGPVTAIYLISKYHKLPAHGEAPTMMLVIGGIGIAVGISALGHRVMKTVGEGITKLNNSRGFSVDFSVASTVLLASRLGIPVSSTTVAVGAVTGVGLVQGRKNVDHWLLAKIFLVWVVTIPIAAVTCGLIFLLLRTIFL